MTMLGNGRRPPVTGGASFPGTVAGAGAGLLWGQLGEAVRLLDFGQDALLGLDEGEQVVLCNRGAEHLFGVDRGGIEGVCWPRLLAETTPGTLRAALARVDAAVHTGGVELPAGSLCARRWDGAELPLAGSVSALRLGPLVGYALLLRDVGGADTARGGLDYLALHDLVTGLPGRALLLDRLAGAVRRHRRDRRQLALLTVAIDDLALINLRFGRAAGDAVLRGCAERIEGTLRHADSAARLGGGAFAVLLEQVDGAAGVHQACGRIARALGAGPVRIDRTPVDINASLGLALFPRDGDSAEGLLRASATALARARRACGQLRFRGAAAADPGRDAAADRA